jgi:hypothetical protein
MSAFASIQAAIIAALSAATALAGGRIYANRLRPIADGTATAIVVRLEQASGTEMVIGTVDWQSSFTVECFARATTGTDPAAAVDTLLSDVWARLSVLSFETLGANVALDPRIDWQYDELDTPMVCAVLRLSAQHRTTNSTLTA